MKRQVTRLLTALLAVLLLLPVTAKAESAWDGWTAEMEEAYQTVSGLVVSSVSESKDYLSTARQETNAKAVYALWVSGADVPEDFYNEYLQALADWLALAEQRGKYAYVPGALRTVAAMGLDVTDFAGHDLLEPLRRPEMVEADEDRLDMLLDLDAAGDAGKTDEFNALRETLIAEALARQQSSGEFRYTSKWPAELKQKGVAAEPDRFDYILLTAKSAQALAPYRSRAEVGTAIEKAIGYLSAQQLDSGGFLRYGEEDVEEDAVVLEMMQALDIASDDERFVKNGNTVPDGMMGWYQERYFDGAKNNPKQGFYSHDVSWQFNELWGGWYRSVSRQMPDPSAPDDINKAVTSRVYINPLAYAGLCSIRLPAVTQAKSVTEPNKATSDVQLSIKYTDLINEQTAAFEKTLSDGSIWNENMDVVTEKSLAQFANKVIAYKKANGELSKSEKERLSDLMVKLIETSSEYYMGLKSDTYSRGIVEAFVILGIDPENVSGLDYLAPLVSTDGKSFAELDDALKDFDSVDESVWRKRGVDADMIVDEYAAAMIDYQMPNGKFDDHYQYVLEKGDDWQTSGFTNRDEVKLNADIITALAPHMDKEYIAEAVNRAVDYLSSVQLADGSFPGRNGLPDGDATLAVLNMMDAMGISLEDERFVKNGTTVADGLKSFYFEDVGFVSRTEVDATIDDLANLPANEGRVMDLSSTVSALTYLQAAENGTFGPDGKGSSVFEVVGAALTETPLGAILLAVIVVGILAFAMVRRYRRIKREQ